MNAPRPTPSKYKIFLIDDHELMLRSLTQMIAGEADLAVCGSGDGGPQTVAAVDACKPDLVLMDTSLQGGHGMKLLEKLKSRWPKMPVVVVSLYDSPPYVQRVMQAGASGHLSKNQPAEALLQSIRESLG